MKNFKFLSLIVATLVVFSFAQCSDDDDGPSNELPAQAETFLADTFPNVSYEVQNRKGPGGSNELYAVLDNGAHVNFKSTGEVVYVGGKIDKVPDAVIPEKIRNYVSENYPTAAIVEWELDDDEQEVELSNNIELVFDLDGNYLYSDNDLDNDDEVEITLAELPEAIKTFVETHFPDIAYRKLWRETHGSRVQYEVELDNDVEMEFDHNNELTGIESDAGIPDAIVPAKILAYVNENYASALIVEWKLDRRKQEVELDNDVELVFDLDGNFLYADND